MGLEANEAGAFSTTAIMHRGNTISLNAVTKWADDIITEVRDAAGQVCKDMIRGVSP